MPNEPKPRLFRDALSPYPHGCLGAFGAGRSAGCRNSRPNAKRTRARLSSPGVGTRSVDVSWSQPCRHSRSMPNEPRLRFSGPAVPDPVGTAGRAVSTFQVNAERTQAPFRARLRLTRSGRLVATVSEFYVNTKRTQAPVRAPWARMVERRPSVEDAMADPMRFPRTMQWSGGNPRQLAEGDARRSVPHACEILSGRAVAVTVNGRVRHGKPVRREIAGPTITTAMLAFSQSWIRT
jgi:hypothetical protein